MNLIAAILGGRRAFGRGGFGRARGIGGSSRGMFAGGGGILGLVFTIFQVRRFFKNRSQRQFG